MEDFNKIDNSKKDVVLKLLEFMQKNNEATEVVSEKLFFPCNEQVLSILFKNNEIIRTDANEKPNEFGGWDYNNNRTHDYFYAIIDNDQLLAIRIDAFLSTGECETVTFKLYPLASKMKVNVKCGHEKRLYLTIMNEDNNMVSEFFFEKAWNNYPLMKDAKLDSLITPVSVLELEKRLQSKVLIRKK